jgi:hypothetical protein
MATEVTVRALRTYDNCLTGPHTYATAVVATVVVAVTATQALAVLVAPRIAAKVVQSARITLHCVSVCHNQTDEMCSIIYLLEIRSRLR